MSTPSSSCLSSFTTPYSGLLLHVQSFLTFPELLRLARVSKYYRGIALGENNPTGRYRNGHEKSYIVWDILAEKQKQQDIAAAALPSEIFENPPVLSIRCFHKSRKKGDFFCDMCEHIKELPSFHRLAELSLHQHAQSHFMSPSTISKKEVEDFLAVIPAPSYGAPATARQCSYPTNVQPRDHQPRDLLLLSPIVARHVQDLDINYENSASKIALICLRFPFIRSLSFELWKPKENDSLVIFNQSFSLRLPPNLRCLRLCREWESPVQVMQMVLNVLPEQCPLLEELRIEFDAMHLCEDLSPLLLLPQLRRLTIPNFQFGEGSSNRTGHRAVMSKLSGIRSLRVHNFSKPAVIDDFLPDGVTMLEEFPLATLANVNLPTLAARVPHLRAVESYDGGPCRFLMTDFSFLLQFRSLQTLKFTHHLLRVGSKGFTPNGFHFPIRSGGFTEHLISTIKQLQTLTELNIHNLYAPWKGRSIQANAEYFESRDLMFSVDSPECFLFYDDMYATGTSADIPSVLKPSSNEPVPKYEVKDSLAPYDSTAFASSLYPVFQLTSSINQLVSLTLSHSSALHLPSLSFLSAIPQLQSFSLSHAYFLPLESLYDLQLVAKTLTRLEIKDCFPSDPSLRSVYLLHDVLQPFQFSFPVTTAVTIQFPERMRKHDVAVGKTSSDSSAASSSPLTCTVFFTSHDTHQAVNQSSSAVSPALCLQSHRPVHPPRHSSWFEIMCAPPESRTPPSRDELLSKYLSDCNDDQQASSHHRHSMIEVGDQQSFRLIFDSFTIAAEPQQTGFASESDSNNAQNASQTLPLQSHLLPKLEYCFIEHTEPHMIAGVFIFDSSKVPRHRFRHDNLPMSDYEKHWLDVAKEDMYILYDIRPDAVQNEIDRACYISFVRTCKPHFRDLRH